jgi:DNA-binding transcriptional LysR family regulator
VTLANLRLIRDVAHCQSISKAARLSAMSQSAVSQAVQEVEREISVQIFDRSTRPLTVTAAGKLYVDYCRDVLRRQEEFETSLKKLKMETDGRVRLAAIYSIALSEMSEIEAKFAQAFPQAHLDVSYLRPERVWTAVENDQADLGIVSYAESSRDVVALPWRDEEMVVAAAPSDPLIKLQMVSAKDLAGATFVGFDDDLPIQSQIDRYFRDHRVSVETTLRFDNLVMIKQAVAHGAGISIMPKRVMREDIAANRLVALPLDPPELYRPVRIIHRRRKSLNQVSSGLLELLLHDEAQLT